MTTAPGSMGWLRGILRQPWETMTAEMGWGQGNEHAINCTGRQTCGCFQGTRTNHFPFCQWYRVFSQPRRKILCMFLLLPIDRKEKNGGIFFFWSLRILKQDRYVDKARLHTQNCAPPPGPKGAVPNFYKYKHLFDKLCMEQVPSQITTFSQRKTSFRRVCFGRP